MARWPTPCKVPNTNVYFSNGTGAVFGYFNSLDVANIAAWKTAVGQDANSFESNPQYLDPTNAVPDLHINPSVSTVIEGNGVDVGVIDDFDGQTRSGLTPVDIGADAGNFMGIDLAPPVITYAPLGDTTMTGNRMLTATITDTGSGVPTAGIGLPVLYWKINAGSYSPATASYLGGNLYQFTFGAGAVINDTISYYVVAQDGAAMPNVTSNPSAGASGYTADPPAAATPPTTPFNYKIKDTIMGTFTVGAAGAYTTLTNAVTDLNNKVMTGPVVFTLLEANNTTGPRPRNSGEVFPIVINANSGSSAVNTITIKPDTSVTSAITGSVSGALIKLNGASYVIIDGSNSGGTDRSLTIENTGVTTPSVVLVGSLGTTPITSVTVKNCIIRNGVNTNSAVVISDATTLGATGYFSNVTIQNNDIQKAYIGVFATGGTTPQNGSNLTYTGNTVNTSGANAIRDVGLYMQNVNGATVTNNIVGNIDKVSDENDVGIWLATGTINATVSSNLVSGLGYTGVNAFAPVGINITPGASGSNINVEANGVSDISSNGTTAVRGMSVSGTTADLTIQRNNVQGVINSNTGTYGAYGIDLSAGNNIVLKNNFVSNVNHNMTGGFAFDTTFGVAGIRVAAGTGHKIYANSVNLYGLMPGTSTSSLLSTAFALVSTASTGCDVRDNIFANNITGGTTSIAHVAVYLPSGGTGSMLLTENYNAYYNGTDAARAGVAQAGATAGTNFFVALSSLQAYSQTLGNVTNDTASLAFTSAVPFATANDLHITCAAPVADMGTPIGSVVLDFDGQSRSATAPDIGADEITAPVPLSVVSRKVHGGAGTFDLPLPLVGPAGIECRNGGGTSDHELVFTFASPVTVASASVNGGSFSIVSATGSGTSTITVDITGVTNAQYITVGLNCVDNGLGASGNMAVTMGVLLGDTTGDGSVNSADIGQVKSQSGNPVSGSNYRQDVTVDGNLNSADIGLVKSKSGTALP